MTKRNNLTNCVIYCYNTKFAVSLIAGLIVGSTLRALIYNLRVLYFKHLESTTDLASFQVASPRAIQPTIIHYHLNQAIALNSINDTLVDLNYTQTGYIKNFGLHQDRTDVVVDQKDVSQEFLSIPEKYRTLSESDSQMVNEFSLDTTYQQKNLYQSCQTQKVIILIKTAVYHTKLRYTIRKTWLNQIAANPTYSHFFQYYFLVAKHKGDNLHNIKLTNECINHRDILVANQFDSYYNVTRKMMMGMKYVLDNCLAAKYVVHLDDDTYFSPSKFFDNMRKYILESDKKQSMQNLPAIGTGLIQPSQLDWVDCGSFVHRLPKDRIIIKAGTRLGKTFKRWIVEDSAWDDYDQYPQFCSGACFGMSINSYRKLYDYRVFFKWVCKSAVDLS